MIKGGKWGGTRTSLLAVNINNHQKKVSMIFKAILFLIAIGWVMSALLRYFLRSKLKKFVDQVNQAQREQYRQQRKPSHGNVNVDFVPKDGKKKSPGHISGGEYVDFEEVKD